MLVTTAHTSNSILMPTPTAPAPPSTPGGVPGSGDTSSEDWLFTLAAIATMTLAAFVVLVILVKRSFRLVPTGVLALSTLVFRDGIHHLPESDDGAGSRQESAVGGSSSRPENPNTNATSRLELLSDSEDDSIIGDDDDAHVLRIRPVDE